MLTADVWQDEYTTGARPPMDQYLTFSEEFGLYDGPIDGWFAVYRKSSLALCRHIQPTKYFLSRLCDQGAPQFHRSGCAALYQAESVSRNRSSVCLLFWDAGVRDR